MEGRVSPWSIVTFILLVIMLCAGGMAGCPRYNVWKQGMTGEAQLALANQNRQIAVREAEAKKDSAVLLAEAEVERAKGVAKANEIIGNSLKNNEAYLRYLWIHNLEVGGGNNQVIYVPTEAGLPLLEANRLRHEPPGREK